MHIKKINFLVLLVTIVCFTWIFLFSLVFDSSVYISQNKFISLIVAFIILIIWFFAYKFLNNEVHYLTTKKEIIFLIIYFLIVLFLEAMVLMQLNVMPGWDYGVIFDNALKYATEGTRNNAVYIEYFQYFPNNILIFVLMLISIKLGNLININPIISIEIMNVCFINFSLIMLYLTIRKKFGVKNSIFSSIISLFFLPIYLYSPIVYSDTLSLFIGISFIYLFLNIDDNKINKKNTMIFILVGTLMFLGKSLKVTSLIVLIALIINLVLKTKIKNSIIYLLTMFLSFILLNSMFNVVIVNRNSFHFNVNDYGQIPYTHWIMMGVEDKDADNSERNTYGGYNVHDYDKTESFATGKDAQKYNIKEYMNRVNKMGFVGYAEFLTKKSVNIWADGYYFSNVKLGISPINNNTILRKFLLQDSTTKYFGIYFTQGVNFSFLIALIIGAVLKVKDKCEEVDYVRLAIIGIMIFLLFWEGRSRYLVNYIPIFIFIIVEFYNLIYIKLYRRKYEK